MPRLVSTEPAPFADLEVAASAGTLYAVLDACDEPRVPVKIRELDSRAASLYEGKSQEELWGIAPYLVQVDEPLLAWIQASLWNDPWGIFAIAEVGLAALRTHFRKFLLVKSPDEEEWYFRFYDPRVIAAFLPTCDATELAEFFGPIATFGWVEPDSGGVKFANRAYFGDATSAKPRITLRKAK